MFYLRRYFLFSWLISMMAICSAHASITTCNNIQDLEKHIEPGTLCVFDFDNTLFECVDENAGSDQWFSRAMDYLKPYNVTQLFSKMLNLYRQKHQTALIKPVEQQTIPFLEKLLSRTSHINVLVLTARSIIEETDRELENIVYHNEIRSFSFAPFHMLNIPSLTIELSHENGLYKDGIMFCNGNKKSEALEKILNYTQRIPKKIVFIDDRRAHVDDIAALAKHLNIPFQGFHYTYLDDKVASFELETKDLVESIQSL